MSVSSCPLCQPNPTDTLLWQDDFCRVVLVADPLYPAFCRVILHAHIAEMSDLPPHQQQRLMQVVFTVERGLRDLMQPTKMNIASFGNTVPHIHWHIIPRFTDDTHYPQPTWGEAQRTGVAHKVDVAALIGILSTQCA